MTRLNKLRIARVAVLLAATAVASPAQTFATLANFDGTDGSSTFLMSLAQGANGSLHGTTAVGGPNNCGTVFKITTAGVLTMLHQSRTSDGDAPEATLVLGTDGALYGTTAAGGNGNCPCSDGCGTVFRMSPKGEVTTLHIFHVTD